MSKNPYWVFFYTILSAVLVYLSLPNCFFIFGFWPLAWVSLVPLFKVLDGETFRNRLKYGSIFSVAFFSLLVSWVLPINFWGYLSFVFVLSLGPLFFALLFSCPFQNKILKIFYYPALWVMGEFLRSNVLGGFSWTLGHSQSFHTNAIQIANITGSYGISFLLVLFNYCIYGIFRNYSDKYLYASIAMVAILTLFVYGYFSVESDQRKATYESFFEICGVQPNISPQEKWDEGLIDIVIDKHIELSRMCITDFRPDLVVWPETAIPDDFIRNPRMRDKVTEIAKEVKSNMLIGAALYENERDYNSAVLLNGEGAVLDIYRKNHLVPFSEYLPLKEYLSFLRDIFHFNIYDFYSGIRPGIFSIEKQIPGKEKSDYKFGVALCSEGSYPALFRNLVSKKVGFIILMLNDGWFKQDAAMILHAQGEIMRAVENRIPIVRVANSGWSCSIDQYGRVKTISKQSPRLNRPGFYMSHIYPNYQRTFYNQFGDIFALLCGLFVIIVFVLQGIFYFRQRQKE